MADILTRSVRTAEKNGESVDPMEKYIVDRFGYDEWIRMCEELGGERHYIPKTPSIQARDESIRLEYETITTTGHRVAQMAVYDYLARKYQLSLRQVRRVVRVGGFTRFNKN